MEFQGNNDYRANTDFKINVLLGKNGCGKSTALKAFEQELRGKEHVGAVRYITPERGGKLQYEPNVEHNITSNVNWLNETRRVNQFAQFRQQSVAQFRKLEILSLREIEADRKLRENLEYTFDSIVLKINSLLDNVEIKRADAGFDLFRKGTDQKLTPAAISSGESELISLSVECLVFSKECKKELQNILLFDEPDVHLHPDLQAKLMKFICDLVEENDFYVFIATHSTAIVGSLDVYRDIGVHLMQNMQKNLDFKPVHEMHRRIIPVFGAHPLSNLFNQTPIFLVEGEDDFRIWQQAVRTSHGTLSIYPCAVNGVDSLAEWEDEVITIINSVYDNACAYSLRDSDDIGNPGQELDDKLPLIRLRLCCRAAENLLLCDEVLNALNVSWKELCNSMNRWIEGHEHHIHYATMCEFRSTGFNRKHFNLKDIRNDLIGIIGSSKPWEVAVGQVIGHFANNGFSEYPMLREYLGEKIVGELSKTVGSNKANSADAKSRAAD